MLTEIEWHPTGKQLRVFGVGGLLASSAAALMLHFVWGAAGLWVAVVLAAGVAICLCSLVSPAATRIVYIGMTLVAMPIGFIVSFVLLAVFYFLLLTPIALVFRLIGRDALCRSWRGHLALAPRGAGILPSHRGQDARDLQGRDALATYWVPHKANEDMQRYFHQF
jgi:hypothetical protein